MSHRRRFWSIVALVTTASIYAINTNFGVSRAGKQAIWLAHAGVHQNYDLDGVGNDTCTASRIKTPTHEYIDNTIESVAAAFRYGGDVVEIDVQPTADGQFVVFHDWRLECRTNGQGLTRNSTLAELKALDIGYGYTADEGTTFPLRGQGIGKMPSLDEMLSAFPAGRFFLNVKSNDPEEGRQIASFIRKLPERRRADLVVYGGDRPISVVRALLPSQRVVSKATIGRCLKHYAAVSWTGARAESCRRTAVLVPINVAPFLWGWPNRFLNRMDAVDAQVFVLGPYHGEGFTSGLDNLESLQRLPSGFSGGIWTNRIEAVGPNAQPTPTRSTAVPRTSAGSPPQ